MSHHSASKRLRRHYAIKRWSLLRHFNVHLATLPFPVYHPTPGAAPDLHLPFHLILLSICLFLSLATSFSIFLFCSLHTSSSEEILWYIGARNQAWKTMCIEAPTSAKNPAVQAENTPDGGDEAVQTQPDPPTLPPSTAEIEWIFPTTASAYENVRRCGARRDLSGS